MPDTEAFIERLTAENHDFRTLREEHHRYEEELAALNTRGCRSFGGKERPTHDREHNLA